MAFVVVVFFSAVVLLATSVLRVHLDSLDSSNERSCDTGRLTNER